ncbi:CRP-like cAMP-binding protein [Actinopolyspora lacussalsi]|nr:CRP-like cAMP-binding protein [Actinopolyspora lacussalsi]
MSDKRSECGWYNRLLEAAGSGIREDVLERGENIYTCGKSDPVVYLVSRGQVKSSMLSQSGKRCLLAIHTAGDLFGESCLLNAERSEEATAMTEVVLKRIPSDRFLAALASNGALEEFVTYLVGRMAEQQQVITNLVTVDSEKRLAATLLRLARKLGRRDTDRLLIEQYITQEELSGMVGTTRSRVGYFLKRFRADGFIRTLPGAFIEVNEARLNKYLQLSV